MDGASYRVSAATDVLVDTVARRFVTFVGRAGIGIVAVFGLEFAFPRSLVTGPHLTHCSGNTGERLITTADRGITTVEGAWITVVRTDDILVDT